MTISDNNFSRMFVLAGLWNIGIGLTGACATDFSVALFFGPGAVTDAFLAALSFKLFMVAITVFGVGYYMVSRDLTMNRGIIWLGLACKMILFFLFNYLFFTGRATILAVLTVTGDFIWSLLFILFLYQTRARLRSNVITG
jgi:hypothetical protein